MGNTYFFYSKHFVICPSELPISAPPAATWLFLPIPRSAPYKSDSLLGFFFCYLRMQWCVLYSLPVWYIQVVTSARRRIPILLLSVVWKVFSNFKINLHITNNFEAFQISCPNILNFHFLIQQPTRTRTAGAYIKKDNGYQSAINVLLWVCDKCLTRSLW